jgi:hypothetical protein
MASPGSQSPEEDDSLIIIPIDRTYSDGDPAFWPPAPRYQMVDDTAYRRKLAVRWLQETGGAYEEGMFCLISWFFLVALQIYMVCFLF